MSSYMIMIQRPNGQCTFKGYESPMMPPPNHQLTSFLVRADNEHDAKMKWCEAAGFDDLRHAARECQCDVSDIAAIRLGPIRAVMTGGITA